MDNLRSLISDSTWLSTNTINFILTVTIILLLWLVRRILISAVIHGTEDIRSRYVWKKTVTYTTVSIGMLLVFLVWFAEGLGSIEMFLGLMTAGVAIALKDIITNVAGWAFIMVVRPLDVGDRIQIGDFSGDVLDIGIFQLTLMEIGNWVNAEQSTGRVIKIPNGFLFTQALANYSKGFQYIWQEIPVLVTFESDWEKAKGILLTIAQRNSENLSTQAEKKVKEASERFLIFYSKLTPIVYTSVEDCGVLLTIRCLSKPRQRRSSTEAIWEGILREFAKCDDIDFAYPTTRFYDNMKEGKSGKLPD